MTFDEIYEEVQLLVNRPDLVNLVRSRIRAATLKAHQTDLYYRDIYEASLQFDDKSFFHSLDLNDLYHNFRTLHYLRVYKDDEDTDGMEVEIVSPREVLDEYNTARTNIAYLAGRNIEIRATCEFTRIRVGMYMLPIATREGYSSWVAEKVPDFIIHEAARQVFSHTGYAEEARAQAQLVSEQLVILKQLGLVEVE